MIEGARSLTLKSSSCAFILRHHLHPQTSTDQRPLAASRTKVGGIPLAPISVAPRGKEMSKIQELKIDRTFSELVHGCHFAKCYGLTPTVIKNVTA